MTRDVFSDAGSDLKSVIGGRLKGIEAAVDRSWEESATLLRQWAHAMGAEAVIGLDVSVQTVSDKAQLILMVGTAIRESATHRPRTEPHPSRHATGTVRDPRLNRRTRSPSRPHQHPAGGSPAR